MKKNLKLLMIALIVLAIEKLSEFITALISSLASGETEVKTNFHQDNFDGNLTDPQFQKGFKFQYFKSPMYPWLLRRCSKFETSMGCFVYGITDHRHYRLQVSIHSFIFFSLETKWMYLQWIWMKGRLIFTEISYYCKKETSFNKYPMFCNNILKLLNL